MESADLPKIGYDAPVFERFYLENVEQVQRFVARRIEDPHLVADLTAEVFLAAIDSADRYVAGRGTPIAWLYGIARNTVAAEGRRHGREHAALPRVGGRRALDDDDVARLMSRIDAEAESRRLHHAMARLGEGERVVLEFVALDGLTVPEAAKAIGIRPATARVRLHRARRTMRSALTNPDPLLPNQPIEV